MNQNHGNRVSQGLKNNKTTKFFFQNKNIILLLKKSH